MSRRGFAILVVATLVVAWGAWAPVRAGVPETVLPLRQKQLSGEQYRHARDEWKAFAEAHPDDAHAWAQLARASWYCNDPRETSQGYAEKAHRLNADDPDACCELAKHRWVTWTPDAPTSPDDAIRLCEHALAVAPQTDDARVRLWVMRLAKGDRAAAERELGVLLDNGRIPEPLVDFCWNELVALAPDAILFTNGDNDTYPAIALQVARGLRPDVTVVNLSMLNLGWYRKMLAEGPRPVPVPLLDQSPSGTNGGAQALNALLAKVGTPDCRRPVYFAVTVPCANYEVTRSLSLEGTVYRVLPNGKSPMQADTARLERNLGSVYRLQSATSPALDWNQWSTLRAMIENYAAMDVQLGMARAKAGHRVGAGRAFERALRLADFHHSESVKDVLEAWRKCDPTSPALLAWTKRLGK